MRSRRRLSTSPRAIWRRMQLRRMESEQMRNARKIVAASQLVADMMIRAEEVHAFEEENEMGRRVAAGPGVSTSYDWEGMNIALIVRIFDQGLPDTQADLVAEMQEWFADRSDGKKMPDSRSIRRRITPIWRALQRGDA